jgi:small subunit ribosomal protein S15
VSARPLPTSFGSAAAPVAFGVDGRLQPLRASCGGIVDEVRIRALAANRPTHRGAEASFHPGSKPVPPGIGAASLLPYARAGLGRPRASSRRTGAADDSRRRSESEMGLTKEAKLEIVEQHGSNGQDTGSAPVQIALLTRRINELTQHLRTHPKDHYSRRGLLKLVGRRRRFLNYLQKHDLEGYRALIKELGLRR